MGLKLAKAARDLKSTTVLAHYNSFPNLGGAAHGR